MKVMPIVWPFYVLSHPASSSSVLGFCVQVQLILIMKTLDCFICTKLTPSGINNRRLWEMELTQELSGSLQ